jgi:hypothetical protein
MKKFTPIIGIFAVIIAFTALATYLSGSWDTMYAMRMFMAGFFLTFGAFKAANWKGFVSAYRMYDVVAMRSAAYAYAYPAIELALGFSYLFGTYPVATSVATFAFSAIGTVGVLKALARKEEITCACLGAVFKIPMTKVTLFEDMLMAVMALGMLVWG